MRIVVHIGRINVEGAAFAEPAFAAALADEITRRIPGDAGSPPRGEAPGPSRSLEATTAAAVAQRLLP